MLLASCVAALGVAFLWVDPEPMWEHRCPLTLDLTMPEGTGLHVSSSWWPPGTECEYTFPDGTTTNSTYVPWAEWLIVLALAAALGAIASRLLPVGARPSPTFALSRRRADNRPRRGLRRPRSRCDVAGYGLHLSELAATPPRRRARAAAVICRSPNNALRPSALRTARCPSCASTNQDAFSLPPC